MTGNSFGALDQLTVVGTAYDIFRLDRVEGSSRLPYSLEVLLENLLRNEDGHLATSGDAGGFEDIPREAMAAMREVEQQAAAAAVGVHDVEFLRSAHSGC